ncbi:hypothetical protein FQN54_002439 [Arachnomyces sp. PD_36]|nr:hypothetical protein FQN54_002439 [Arachnomyces sp. PD_36]
MRSLITATALGAALLPSFVSAHGYVSNVTVGGKTFPGSDPVWFYFPDDSRPETAGWDALNQDLGFVSPSAFGTVDIACHISATAGKLSIDANAGDSVDFIWNDWADSHKGPIINYIAPCDGDCSTATAGDLKFTKISASGLLGADNWATDEMMANDFTSSMTLPANLKAGNYVIRHEIIALHGGGSENGAQNYPQCLNFKVGGSGTVAPPAGTAGTALYKSDDPGILFDIYNNVKDYPIPGPELWTGAN